MRVSDDLDGTGRLRAHLEDDQIAVDGPGTVAADEELGDGKEMEEIAVERFGRGVGALPCFVLRTREGVSFPRTDYETRRAPDLNHVERYWVFDNLVIVGARSRIRYGK